MVRSMRYRPDELLSGLLASVAVPKFTDSPEVLGATINQLGEQFPVLQPFASGYSQAKLSEVAQQALKTLVERNILEHRVGQSYVLSDEGKARCRSSKQTLFNSQDIAELEEAALLFEQQCGLEE